MSLRARLTAVIAVIVVVATVAVAFAAFGTTRRQLYAGLDRSLAQVARVAESGEGRGMRGIPGLPPLLRVGDQVVAQVVDADEVVQLLTGPAEVSVPSRVLAEARAGAAVTFSTQVAGEPYRALARPVTGDAVLVVAADVSEQVRVLRALLARIWVIGALVAGLAATVGWFAAGALVGPLRRLTAAAEHVSRTGDLDVGVRTDAPDEAGRLSRAFDDMLVALRASQAQQQQLVDDAGHELRTPIASIRSNAEVLRRHPDLDLATREQIADDVISESAELTTLVNALVDLAGVSGATEPPTEVDLADLVRAAARRLPSPDRGRVQVTGTAVAVLRAAQVHRAVTNLLGNAAKFDPSGAPIEVRVGRSGTAVEVEVRDHGPGIATDDLPHVFARFYRAQAARATPGSGLGLAIVADVATRNGGSVAAANHPDGGAVLRLTLPATAVPPDPG